MGTPDPIATYRLQLRPGFGLKEATEVIDYLSQLGISHLYTSPYLQAVKDSTHGYDVVDPSKINAQLGDEHSHRKFCEKIQASGLGLMIDVVPNHMAIISDQNPWWWDVLENGPSSRYATYFDVDWSATEERWPNKVLLPVLEDHYGRVLESGKLQLSFQEGSIVLHYKEQRFPLDPSSLAGFFSRVAAACKSELLAFLGESYARLPKPTVTSRQSVLRRQRDKEVLLCLLIRICQEEPDAKQAIDQEISRLNHNVDALDELIDQQNYRLSYWRTASRDLGYRRFFDIKELVGLRIEDYEVFQATHTLPMEWYKKGWVQGLRIDHPDGLRNPSQYFMRLKEVCPKAWIIAEKILSFGEKFPDRWKIEGTTGYDFLNLLNELFIDPEGKEPLTAIYKTFSGEDKDFPAILYQSKYLVLTELFGSEVHQLTTLFVEICEKHRRHRDYTSRELREAILQTAACFPVYRSYVFPAETTVSQEDQNNINQAVNLAMKEKPDLDPELLNFLRDLLLLSVKGTQEGEFAMRFQQLTAPAMAKGFEDTALYRYLRLASINEVGSDPTCFGTSLAFFHESCLTALREKPLSLLATTTHDTKRSEDVRARLALLSEIPEQFGQALLRWSAMSQNHRSDLVDPNTEYLFYQTLIGAWPIEEERMLRYMEKAIKEAKGHTSWTKPNHDYEMAIKRFVVAVMQDKAFLSDFETFVAPLIYSGRVNSLAQTLVKLTVPGIPDLYQGCELWNDTLVDPDNRQAVDYSIRQHLLDELRGLTPKQILDRMDEGLPKLWVVHKALQQRKRIVDFNSGSYKALYASGRKADHVVSFIRSDILLTIAPRFLLRLKGDWEDTCLELPEGKWHNLFTGETFVGGKNGLDTLLKHFPVALLTSVP